MARGKKSVLPSSKVLAEAPVVALVGKDSFLRGEVLDGLMAELGQDDSQRTDVSGESAVPGELFDELRSMAMFGGRRVVVIRNGEDFITRNREAFENFLAAVAGGDSIGENRLVIHCESLPGTQKVSKLIAKVGAVAPCEAPTAGELPRWIIARAKQRHQLEVSREAAGMLADFAGSAMGLIDNELAKLALQERPGPVEPREIVESVSFRKEQQMMLLLDVLSRSTPQRAVTAWRELLASDPTAEFRAVTWLTIWLERAVGALRLDRRGENPGSIARQLKIWPADSVGALLERARRLGPTGLRNAANSLAEADYRVKRGVGQIDDSVERFLLTVATA